MSKAFRLIAGWTALLCVVVVLMALVLPRFAGGQNLMISTGLAQYGPGGVIPLHGGAMSIPLPGLLIWAGLIVAVESMVFLGSWKVTARDDYFALPADEFSKHSARRSGAVAQPMDMGFDEGYGGPDPGPVPPGFTPGNINGTMPPGMMDDMRGR